MELFFARTLVFWGFFIMVILEDYVSFTTQFSEAICFHAFSLKHKSQKQIYSEKYKNQLLRSLFFFLYYFHFLFLYWHIFIPSKNNHSTSRSKSIYSLKEKTHLVLTLIKRKKISTKKPIWWYISFNKCLKFPIELSKAEGWKWKDEVRKSCSHPRCV